METITKKRTSRVLILALSALAMLLTGVVVASSASAAKATNTCPSGFTLTTDGASCYQASQTQTVRSQPTCKEGSLTASKTHCWVLALSTTNTITETADVIVTTSRVCPVGSERIAGQGDSLQCAKPGTGQEFTDPVRIISYSCPPGAAASGAGLSLRCQLATAGAPPTPAIATTTYVCPAGTSATGEIGPNTKCERPVPIFTPVDAVSTTTYSCPTGSVAASGSGETLVCVVLGFVTVTGPPPTCAADQSTLASGNCKAATGTFTTVPAGSTCAAGTEQDGSAHPDGSIKCFPAVPPSTCTASFEYQPGSQTCTQQQSRDEPATPDTTTTWRCPPGSVVRGGSGPDLECGVPTVGVEFLDSIGNTTYTCPGGTSPHSGTGPTLLCAYPTQLADVEPIETVTYGCPKDSIVKGAGPTLVCFRNVVIQVPVIPLVATTRSCPKTFNTIGSGAKMTCTRTITSTPIVSCENGTAPSSATIWGKPVSVCIVGAAHVSVSSHQVCARGTLSADKTLCFISATRPGGNPSVRPEFTG